jgi:hypothetical protein
MNNNNQNPNQGSFFSLVPLTPWTVRFLFLLILLWSLLPILGNEKKENKKDSKPSAALAARSARRRKRRGPAAAVKIPQVYPTSKCKLRLLKLERIKDFLLMEEEFIRNQELLRPREEQNEV